MIKLCIYSDDTQYAERLARGLALHRKRLVVTLEDRQSFFYCQYGDFDLVMLDVDNLLQQEEEAYFQQIRLIPNIVCLGTGNVYDMKKKREKNMDMLHSFSKSYCYINKYNSIINIYQDLIYVLSLYSKNVIYPVETGKSEIIGFISLMQGSGCTSAAVSVAGNLSKKGHKVIYLSLERIVSKIWNDGSSPYNMDYYIYSMFSDLDVRKLSLESFICEDLSGVRHFRHQSQANCLCELDDDRLMAVIESIVTECGCDFIILDLGDILSLSCRPVLDICSKLFCVKCDSRDIYSRSGAAETFMKNSYAGEVTEIQNFVRNMEDVVEETDGATASTGTLKLCEDCRSFDKYGEDNKISLDGLYGKGISNICRYIESNLQS